MGEAYREGWERIFGQKDVRAVSMYGAFWAGHCRDSHRGCCFSRNSCACACAKCINVRARMILDDDAVADSPKPLRPGK